MKLKLTQIVFSLFFFNILSLVFAQQPDTTKPLQIRRGIPLQEGYQSYEDYYAGKDMLEEKRSHFPLTGTGTWTELNPKVPRVDYIGLHFINADTGWACGGSGAIIKTTNGGDDWTIAETPTTNLLLKIHSYNGQLVICTGYDGLILRSSDSGETFEQVVSGVGSGTDLWGVQMLNDTLGWVCGMNQTLLKTTDAGINWQQVFPGVNQHYWSLDFLNEQYGMIACGGGIVLKTTDGGNSWTQTQAGDTRSLYTIDIIDSLHIAAAGYEGKNVYSSDGGVSWISNPDLIAFTATNWIDFIDADTGYSVQDVYQIRKTTNRGQSWFNPNSANWGGEWHIQLLEDGTGYSCGDEIGGFYALNFYKRTGGLDNWEKIFLNDNFSDVYFITETTGFVLSGLLYRTTNGGIDWEKVADAPGGSDLLFIDSLTGFIGGSNAIYKTTDGGVSWYATIGTTGAGKIFFIDSTVGWAVHSRSIYKTTDTGENWIEQITLPADSYTSIYFIDSLNGWATSRYVWQTTDGGENWIERTDIPIFFSNDVYFPNLDTGWVARQSSINTSLFKTTNRGMNWSEIPEVLGANKFYVFPDPAHLLITGYIVINYVVFKKYISYDAGNNWIDISNDVPTGFSGFAAVTNILAYAVGSSGLILRYTDTVYVPVELILFEGESKNNEILLSWITGSELNNYGYYIEKSFDQENWFTIGLVEGKGTTTEINYYSFVDKEINSNIQFYRLKQVDYIGSYEYSKIIEINTDLLLSSFQFYQNYPNPFNSSTIITYQIPVKSFINISVYDIKGEKIIELLNDEKEQGLYKIKYENKELPSGIYFIRMITSTGYSAVIKITLIK